jgi:hypothetical protein
MAILGPSKMWKSENEPFKKPTKNSYENNFEAVTEIGYYDTCDIWIKNTWGQSLSLSGKDLIMRSFLVNGCNIATSRCPDSFTVIQATVTPPSSESENRMRKVPFSLLCR